MELAAIAAVLTAMGGIVKMILTHLDKQTGRFEQFLGNHLSKVDKSLEHNSQAIEANTLVLRSIARRVEKEDRERES